MRLQDWEKILANFWEGIFAKSSKQVQPVEIARALVREMAQQKRVSVSRVYAPNVFVIHLGEADYGQTLPLQAALARELEEHVRKKAKEREYTLIGRPQVSFAREEGLAPGIIRVSSVYEADSGDYQEADIKPETSTSIEKPKIEHTMIFDKEQIEQEEPETRSKAGLYLVVVHGPDRGKRVLLEGTGPFTIGRRETNYLVLKDINSSRDHARLEWRNGVLFLTDLNSRNGTYINGVSIDRQRLEIGDQIQIGENLLQIEGV